MKFLVARIIPLKELHDPSTTKNDSRGKKLVEVWYRVRGRILGIWLRYLYIGDKLREFAHV